MEKAKMIEVVKVEPGKVPFVVSIENTLASLQNQVGGYIELCYPFEDEGIAIVCNEEGKINSLPLNRAMRGADGKPYDIIAGTFLVAGLGEEGEFISLTEEQENEAIKMLLLPEIFLVSGPIMVIPMDIEIACKNAIVEAINDNYDHNSYCLSHSAPDIPVRAFGKELVCKVLANSIRFKPLDGRWDRENVEWAKHVEPVLKPRETLIDEVHVGLLNLFTNMVRRE